MTIHMKDFGKYLVTRQAAKSLLSTVEMHDLPVLDFAGVSVANHPFMDALGKGITTQVPFANLSSIQVNNTNPYIDNCVAAGFATASA
jgi:hypothetical protein